MPHRSNRRIIVQEIASLDGFVADASGGLDFFEVVSDYSEVNQENLAIMESVDTLLLGAKTYRLFVKFWPTAKDEPVAEVVNSMPKIVFSSTLASAPWGRFDPARIVAGDAVDHVRRMKQESGSDVMVWGSISLVQSLLAGGLVDELQLRVLPIMLSSGRRLISEDTGEHRLALLQATSFASGIVALRYAVRRP